VPFEPRRPVTSGYHVHRPLSFSTPVGNVQLLSKPGIFSWDSLDPGARLLIHCLRKDGVPPGTRVLDLGCGNGIIGFAIQNLQPEIDLHLADSSFAAYTAVSLSIERLGYRGRAWHSDVTSDVPAAQKYDLIVCNLPRGRILGEQFLREAWKRLEVGGRLYAGGAKNVGILTRMQTIEDWFGKMERVGTVAGYRVARAIRTAGMPSPPSGDYYQWREASFVARGSSWRYATKPGIFSWQRTDVGTALLIECMQMRQGERLLDLGCGAGQVGLVAAKLAPDVSVVMMDDSLPAVRAARRTAELNDMAASVLASDVGSAVIGERFDVVAANPPFHIGPGAVRDIAAQFIEDSRDVLDAKGRLYLVANAFIPYEKQLELMFRRQEMVHKDSRYKVLLGVRPLGRAKQRPKPPIVDMG